MTASQGIWFVLRSHREGPLGKRVRRVAAPTILAWFQAKIEEARIAIHPERVADADLGGPVPGLSALFEAAKKHSLHTPKATTALAKLLHEHVHVEGGSDDVRVDAHSVRVFTTDEDLELGWFFFDDDAVSRNPRALAWLLHDEPRLPEGNDERPYAAAPVTALAPAGEGEGATYACLLTSCDRRSLPGRAVMIPGVRLPALAAHLRAVTPAASAADGHDAWPIELRLLRAMLDGDDADLAPALRRAGAYPLGAVVKGRDHESLGAGAIDAARDAFAAAAEGLAHEGDPARSIVAAGEHAALLAAHTSARLGYQQWILFDDRWAAAHPELSTSILHYAEHADPWTPLRAARPAAPAKPKPAPKAEKARPAAKADKAKSAKPGAKDEQAWKAAIDDRDVASATGYRPTARFDAGALVSHAKFGVGVVTRVEGTKCEVLFRDGPRLLVHGASA